MKQDRVFSTGFIMAMLVFAGYSVIASHPAVAQTTGPTAYDQSLSTDEGVSVDINLNATDPDIDTPLIFSIQSGPSSGILSTLQEPLTLFDSSIDGLQEVPPNNNTTATGNGTFTYDQNTSLLSFDIEYSGLSSNETGAHIHNGTAGAAGPVVFTLPSGTEKTGSVGPLTAEQEKDLFAGNWYVNIHSANFTDGEIRGQILPTGDAVAEVTYTPNPGFNGTDSFVYQVSDGTSNDTGTVTIEVRPEQVGNEPPVADAGADQTVDENDPVSLNGTASSDPDGTIDAYSWTQTAGPAVVLSNANTATPSFTAPEVNATETLTFQLTVTDDAGGNDTDSTNVRVLDDDNGGVREGTFLITMDGAASEVVKRGGGPPAGNATGTPLPVSLMVAGDYQCGPKNHVQSIKDSLEGEVVIDGEAHEIDKVVVASRGAYVVVKAKLDDGTRIMAKLIFPDGSIRCDEASGLDMDSTSNKMRIKMEDGIKYRIDPETADGRIEFGQ